jgi:capsid protein
LRETKGGKIEAYKITSKIKSENGAERMRASWIAGADINVKEQRSFRVCHRRCVEKWVVAGQGLWRSREGSWESIL